MRPETEKAISKYLSEIPTMKKNCLIDASVLFALHTRNEEQFENFMAEMGYVNLEGSCEEHGKTI